MTADELWRLAHQALAQGTQREQHPGEWEAYYTTHGDPYVVERGRGMFGVVATVSTEPDDYGRARAAFMGACDPATIMALLNRLAELERMAGVEPGGDLTPRT